MSECIQLSNVRRSVLLLLFVRTELCCTVDTPFKRCGGFECRFKCNPDVCGHSCCNYWNSNKNKDRKTYWRWRNQNAYKRRKHEAYYQANLHPDKNGELHVELPKEDFESVAPSSRSMNLNRTLQSPSSFGLERGHRCKAAVASPYNLVAGGGERYLLTAAAVFQKEMRCSLDILLFKGNKCTSYECVQRTITTLGIANLIDASELRVRVLPRPHFGVIQSDSSYDFFFFLGNEKAPQVRPIARFNMYMCQFPFDLLRPLTQAELTSFIGYDFILLNSKYSLKHYEALMASTMRVLRRRGACLPVPVVLTPPVEPVARGPPANERELIIVLVGRVFQGRQQKGHLQAIEAFNTLLQGWQDVRGGSLDNAPVLYLVGMVMPGHMRHARRVMAAAEGNSRIRLVFDANRSHVESIMQRALVVWSLTGYRGKVTQQMQIDDDPADAEHFGIAVTEAMSAGAIPVLYGKGGLKELVTFGSGFVVLSLQKLSEMTLRIMIMDKLEKIQMSEKAMRAAARYTTYALFAYRLSNMLHKGHLVPFWSSLRSRVCDQRFRLAPPTGKLVALIVETRVDFAFTLAVKANMALLQKERWRLHVAHGAENAAFVRKALSNLRPVEFDQLQNDIKGDYHYNVLLKSSSFWTKLQAEKVLVFQSDGLILRPGIEWYLRYDYVGAPWSKRNDVYRGVNEEKLHIPSLSRDVRVGNGGLSIRSSSLMTSISEEHWFESAPGEQEDVFFVRHLHKLSSARIASIDEAARFCLEVPLTDVQPPSLDELMAFHQAWLFNKPPVTAKLLSKVLHAQDQARKLRHAQIDQLVVVVPGHGKKSRTKHLFRSLQWLKQSVIEHSIRFECEVFVYESIVVARIEALGCNIHLAKGMWTDFMKQATSDAQFVALMMDDVDVSDINPIPFMLTMQEFGLDVASPAVHDWHLALMRPVKDSVVRNTSYVDMLFTIFTRTAWQCWQKEINVEVNHLGWGYDLTLHKACGVSVGIIDEHAISHINVAEQRTYSHQEALKQMIKWVQHRLGISNNESAKRYIEAVYQVAEASNLGLDLGVAGTTV
mmetsp:Transcript_63203/g.105161  ORF Transcript_63203/g.105161 Transcript_63203/m.105161 type:complete len:1055 (+) Transcript_63203:132-3296(+)